jgi:hypothetical protein
MNDSTTTDDSDKNEELLHSAPTELAAVLNLLSKFAGGTPSKCGKFVFVRKTEIQECITTLRKYVEDTNAMELTTKEMLELKKNSESFGSQPDMVLTHNLFGYESIAHLNIGKSE